MTAPPAEGREEELALARLPLPRSATATATAAPASNPIPAAAPAADPAADPPGPTIRILAVADVDPRSAARLAEYSLRGREDLERAERRSRRGAGLEAGLEAGEMRTRPLGGGRVDLCVACGPFIHRGGGFDGAAVGERGRNETDGSGSDSDSGSDSGSDSDSGSGSSGGGYDNTGGDGDRARRRPAPPSRTGAGVAAGALSRPARRRGTRRRSSRNGCGASSSSSGSTPEQDAADEGTITSTLAQLENIVCRVLYVPGTGDPPSLRGLLVPRRARRGAPPPGPCRPGASLPTPATCNGAGSSWRRGWASRA